TPVAGAALELAALRNNGEAMRKGDSGKDVQRATRACLPTIVMHSTALHYKALLSRLALMNADRFD
ncbi:hypothetical protein HBA55_17845, partial [Pseudomaricurvus alkylphenolicus]|uniref:hypothetical protein n=1 Tax=Pseudomaricurvus alkylphenolicus TaxID=1306991 RepID=UPI00141D8ADC